MNVVQVPFGDSRIGDGTDHGIAMTAPYIALLFAGVKNWTVTKSGSFPDWWNTSPLALPGGTGVLPNHNVWNCLAGNFGYGAFLYSPDTGGTTNVTTPQITMREQYPFSLAGARGTDVAMTTGFAGGNDYSLPDVGIDLSAPVYWDTIGYYPKIFVYSGIGDSFATDKSQLGLSPTVAGQLIIFSYACNIYQKNGFGLSGNLTWNIANTW
jgi:hypothetical protein